jgi:nicotinamidase-related amidase
MFDLSRSALLLIDLQNDFVRKGAPMEVEAARDSLFTVKKLIDSARENRMPIIYTRFVTGPCGSLLWNWSPEIEASSACRRGLKRFYSDINSERLCSDIVDEIYPLPQDYIVEKYGYSAFQRTNLLDILISEGRDSIIVAGTVTQICVADTVHDALSLGIKTMVVQDCATSFSPDLHEAFIRNFIMKFSWAASSEEIINMFRKGKEIR